MATTKKRPTINARVMGSAKNLAAAAKRGGGDTWIKNIPTEGITVRFLSEPEDWVGYMRYWSDDAGESGSYVPMLEGERAPKAARTQQRFVVSALDVENERVVPLDIPKQLVTQIMKFYGKYDTLMDRDYDLSKEGERLDTTYTIVPDSAQKRNLNKYSTIDLLELLMNVREQALNPLGIEDADEDDDDIEDEDDTLFDDDDEDTEEEEEEDNEDDDDEDDEDEADEDVERLSKSDLQSHNLSELKELAEYWEVDPAPTTKAKLVAAILEAQDDYFGDDDEDEPEDEPEDESDEPEDDEDIELDEDDLAKMSLKELRALAEEFDIEWEGVKKAELVELIMENAE